MGRSGGCLRIPTKAVCSSFAVLNEKYDENDSANQWDEADENPPTAATCIVKPSHRYRETR